MVSPEAAEHGRAEFFVLQTDLVARYGLTDHSELFLRLPYRRLRLKVDVEDEHHRNEILAGLGDVRLGAKHFFLTEASFQLAAIVGVSLPTGQRNTVTAASYLGHEDAESIGVSVPRHSHLRLGTGTIDPLLGLEALIRFSRHWMFYVNAFADIPFYADRDGYRTSLNIALTSGPAVRIENTPLILGLFFEVFYSRRDHFDGKDVIGSKGTFPGSLQVPNTGRTEVTLKPTITWTVTGNMTINGQVRRPFYTRIPEDAVRSDVQVAEPVSAFAGISYHF